MYFVQHAYKLETSKMTVVVFQKVI